MTGVWAGLPLPSPALHPGGEESRSDWSGARTPVAPPLPRCLILQVYIYSSKHEPQLYLPLTLADVVFHPNRVARSEIQLWGLGEKTQLCAPSAGLARDLPRSWAGAAAGFPCPPPSISPKALQGGEAWARAEGRGPDSLNNLLS